MTARETIIAKRVLDYLHDLDGGQEHELSVHAGIGGLNLCPSEEFRQVLKILDTERYVVGVTTRFKGVMWSISDLGESARLKM